MKTSRNVYLDIKESPYQFELHGETFYFTSEFYMNKFINGYEDYLNIEQKKINYRYNLNLDLKRFLIYEYYNMIEKRDFLINKNGEFINYVEGYSSIIHKKEV